MAGESPVIQSPGPRAQQVGDEIKVFLIADVRGYTRFTQERGDEAAAQLAAKFAAVAREGVDGSGGSVIELRGDEALAVFSSPRQAVRAAVGLQSRFLEETSADPSLPLRVGIGLDAGEAVPVEDGYRGGPLNVAARLCAQAAPGEVLASHEVVHLARRVQGVMFVEHGRLQLKGLAQPVQVMRVVLEAANPYKGLRPFDEEDASDFFGRDALTEQLVARLSEPGEGSRFLAVVGPSGSGKSSVVRAGLVPAIRGGALPGSARHVVTVMLPGTQPTKELAAALQHVADVGGRTLSDLVENDRQLTSVVDEMLRSRDEELLLVIDQFEEVFTLVEDEEARMRFLETLREAVLEPASRLRVVVTLRADFYDRPLLYKGFGDLVAARTQAVTPLSADELERAISGPAEKSRVTLEPGLVAQVVADVTDQPGALPLLQYALTELFEHRRGNTLTLDAYRAVGGVAGALVRRAESVYDELDDEQKRAARQLFLRLTTSVDDTEFTRRRVRRTEVTSVQGQAAPMESAIEAFGAARLLSLDRDPLTGNPTVEVAHEALLSEWTRLREWLAAAREELLTQHRLAVAARDWLDAGRDPSFLASGSRLDHFETWRDGSGLAMTPEEREFLEASAAERDRQRTEEEARHAREEALERRSFQRLRALVAVLAAAALVAGGLTVFAFNQRGRAERESRVATARSLAAAAVANLDSDPERSILLALEAVEQTRSEDGSVLPEAEEALHRAVTASRIVLSVPGVGGALDWSSRGVFATEGPENTGVIDIKDASTGRTVRKFRGHSIDVNRVEFSEDGSMLATTGDDGALNVWDPVTGRLISSVTGPTHTGAITSSAFGPSFSEDGSLLSASWPNDETVRIVDPATGEVVRSIGGLQGGPVDTALSPDGRLLLVSHFEGEVFVFDVSSGKRLFDLRGHADSVNTVAWSPDGRRIATASNDSSVRVWDGTTGRHAFTLFGHTGSATTVDWSPDGDRLVTAGSDGTARVWETGGGSGRELMSLSAQETTSGTWAVFSPDGTHVMTGDTAITAVKIWDVSIGGDAEWANFPTDSLARADVAFMPDGRVVAPIRRDSVSVWDVGSRREVQTIGPGRGSPRPVTAIDVSPDGTMIATVREFATVANVWDSRTGEAVFEVDTDFASITAVDWSGDGTHLVVSLYDGPIEIFDRSGREIRQLREEAGYTVLDARFSSDGRLLATSGLNESNFRSHATIWDWERGRTVRRIQQRTPIEAVDFDPTGRLIATAHGGGSAEVWEVDSGRSVARLAGHSGPLSDIAFSPEGSRVATAGQDGTVRLYDARSGRQLVVLHGHDLEVSGISFSPDGKRLASAGPDGVVRIWALDLDDVIRIARREVTRGLTDDECRQYLDVNQCPRD
ncbi:MAG TPA: AAA family ATPase [Actinomycetota bacterium]|nr:AAA family ATPase [Actinomycetota bacterium]